MTTFTNTLPLPAGKPSGMASEMTSLRAKTAGFPAHRQYRYYCNDLPILLHNDDSLCIIDPSAFGFGFHNPTPSSLHPIASPSFIHAFPVVAGDRHSTNPDACPYSVGVDALADSPVPLGASGLEGDSGVGPLFLAHVPDGLSFLAEILVTRCRKESSGPCDFAATFFTRCLPAAEREGRVA